MANLVQVVGMKSFLSKAKRVNKTIDAAVEKGMVKAGLFLQRKSQEIVPVEYGVLKRSASTRKDTSTGRGAKAKVTVQYSASYAVYVHEDLHAKHAPGKVAKFLERPARQYRKEMKDIVSKEIRNAK